MKRLWQGLLFVGLGAGVPGCCSMCQSPYDYAPPVASSPYAGNYVGRAGSVTSPHGAGLPVAPTEAMPPVQPE